MPNSVPCASSSFTPSHPPLLGPHARKRARTPARSIRLGRGHRADGVTAATSETPGPQSTPVTDTSRLVAQSRRRCNPACAENPGRRASTHDCTPIAGVYVRQTQKSARTRPRHRLTPRQRPGSNSQEPARQTSIERDRDTIRPHAGKDWISRPPSSASSSSPHTRTSADHRVKSFDVV
jgi:hypothetical protein